MSTDFLTEKEALDSAKWWVIDAADMPVGRLASRVAHVIRGKHKPTWTPNTPCGDFVIVINAEKIKLTGNKGDTKMYREHTNFIGGLKEVKASVLLKNNPEKVIRTAIEGMLPSGVLGHKMCKKLKIYKGSEHTHSAQMPQTLTAQN